jgi:NAD-dependent SIR2 family protein deacetylase
MVLTKEPKWKGHHSLVECENRFAKENKIFTLITQNVDGLHLKAGSKNVIEMVRIRFFCKWR